ncbi:MAG TPA: hypothetical protein VGM56_23455 [Byssovorax sp.]|jgi:hypothetical protein
MHTTLKVILANLLAGTVVSAVASCGTDVFGPVDTIIDGSCSGGACHTAACSTLHTCSSSTCQMQACTATACAAMSCTTLNCAITQCLSCGQHCAMACSPSTCSLT